MNDVSNAKADSGAPLISVLIPVFNEELHLGRILDMLNEQTYPEDKIEILVVDGGSTDSTVEIATDQALSNKMIRVLANPERWSSRGRNVGVRASTGEYVLVIDGHCDLRDRDYVAKVAQLFASSGADCLGRPQPLEIQTASHTQQAIAIARESPIGHHADSWIYSKGEGFVPAISVATAYKKSVFSNVGLFDESFDACEDVEFNYRVDQAGLSCYFSDQIALPYVPRRSLFGLSRQLIRYGRGRARVLRKHPRTFSIKSLAPALFLASIFIGTALSTTFGHFGLITTSLLGLYIAVVLLAWAWSARRAGGWKVILLIPACLMTVHISTGLGTLVEVVSWAGDLVLANRRSAGSDRNSQSQADSQDRGRSA